MGKTILIVDNTLAAIDYIKEELYSFDPFFKFIVASNGIDAYYLADTKEPDLIIMESDITESNGIDTLKRLKRNKSTKNIPVIISTKQTTEDNINEIIENKAFDYLIKPINNKQLITKVNNALTLSNAFQDLKTQKQKLLIEKQKSEMILKALLPAKIIHEIKKTGYSAPKRYHDVVVIFIDFVNFTGKTNTMSPRRLIKELNDLYLAYDEIISKFNCTRIKTVGDAYIATCGLPQANTNAITDSAKATLELRKYIINRNLSRPIKWSIRIGMFYGDVIGSLVSLSNYTFDIFGNTVNMAARFQTLCDPMQINIPESMKEVLQHKYQIIERLPRKVKGTGVMPMYYLHNPLPVINLPKKEDIVVSNKLTLMY